MNKSVEALHNEYAISGETYLFCVENDLQTLEDVANCFADGTAVCSARVRSEIESILNRCAQQTPISTNEVQHEAQLNSEGRLTAYLQLKERCSVRTKNALGTIEKLFFFPSDDFWTFLMDKANQESNFKHIRNVGRKTIGELSDFVADLENVSGHETVAESLQEEPDSVRPIHSEVSMSPQQLSLVETTVKQEMSRLSVRSENGILRVLADCENSIVRFLETLNDPTFDLLTIKNIGNGSLHELRIFIRKVNELWDWVQSPERQIEQARLVKANVLQQHFGLAEQEAQLIVKVFPDAETPPLFKIIDIILKRSQRDWTIISESLNIYNDQTISDRKDLANKFGLTSERVRQLRNKRYEELCRMVKQWGANKGEYDFSPYLGYCQMEYNDQQLNQLNKDEGVNYNSNFIYLILSLFFHEQYTLIGDDIKVLSEPSNKVTYLCIVPRELSGIFDFTALLDDLRLKFNSKAYEDYSIELNQYLLRFFYDDIFFDKMAELLELCGKIIYRVFGVVVIDNTLKIAKNATKPIPEILEDILSEKGEAMSLDEIYEQFSARYPDYSKDKDSLRGNIGRNSNIAPVGRTSSYVLTEWEKKGIKGGTIRDMVFDFLLESDRPLPIEEIVGHVLLFREGTNEKSVYSNMFADNAKRFSAYECDGNRLYGLSQKIYDDKYTLIEDERTGSKRGFKESIELLERFIMEKDRFPFSSSVEVDEMRLCRFWGLHKARRGKGELNSEQLSEIKRIEDLYGDKEYSKKDYLAMQQAKIALMRSTLLSLGIDPDI